MDLKLALTLLTIIVTILLTLFLKKKYQLNREQMTLFLLLVLFWSIVNIIRAYRKSYAMQPLAMGGLELGAIAAANIAAAYGLVSMMMRFPTFFISDALKSRKLMFGAVTAILGLTSLWVILFPSYTSLYASSMAMGLGASMLALFNVTFSESFAEKQAMMSVSILSVAPLMAEFLMSPFQYLTTAEEVKNYPRMWLISLVLSGVTLIFLTQLKEPKKPGRTMTRQAFVAVASQRSIWVLSAVGVLVSFARFGLTGSNFVTYAQSIGMSPLMVAYVELIYSLFQLAAGVLAGLWFARKIGAKNTLLLGLGLSITFNIILLVSRHPTGLFLANGLSGFGYGLTYNSLIGLALQPFERKLREMSMGFFQTFFGLGIFFGDKVYAWMRTLLPDSWAQFRVDQATFWVVLIISLLTAAGFWILAPDDRPVTTEQVK